MVAEAFRANVGAAIEAALKDPGGEYEAFVNREQGGRIREELSVIVRFTTDKAQDAPRP